MLRPSLVFGLALVLEACGGSSINGAGGAASGGTTSGSSFTMLLVRQ